MLTGFVLRWFANGLGLWIADRLLTEVRADSLMVIIIAALVFSVVNALVRPLVILLSLPAIVISLGLFMLVINGLMLYLVTLIYPSFEVLTFGAAIVTVIIVWLANYAVSTVFHKG